MTYTYFMYICSEQMYMFENLLPRLRTTDEIPVRADGNLIRQLMLQGEIRRYVSTISRIMREFRTTVGMRIENHDLFSQFVPNQLYWTDEVRIPANQNKHIHIVLKRIPKHCRRNVDVGTLFLQFHDVRHAAGKHTAFATVVIHKRSPSLVFIEKALMDTQTIQCRQTLKVNLLPFNRRLIVRIGLDT